MIITRLSKAALVAAIAFCASLVAFGNLTDYSTNWAFVTHVLSMDTIFPGSTIRYRAITNPALQGLAYWLIIAAELATAVLCWIGVFGLLSKLSAPAVSFNDAKRWAIAGLTLGFLTWQVGFMTVGGEWFGMWQSETWNGEQSAFRFHMTIIAVLIYLVLPDRELSL
jgi:predicted small integral membrane protein